MEQYDGGPEIATYDRILDAARQHDEGIRERKRSKRQWRREVEKG
jgi:hypothetical protein